MTEDKKTAVKKAAKKTTAKADVDTTTVAEVTTVASTTTAAVDTSSIRSTSPAPEFPAVYRGSGVTLVMIDVDNLVLVYQDARGDTTEARASRSLVGDRSWRLHKQIGGGNPWPSPAVREQHIGDMHIIHETDNAATLKLFNFWPTPPAAPRSGMISPAPQTFTVELKKIS